MALGPEPSASCYCLQFRIAAGRRHQSSLGDLSTASTAGPPTASLAAAQFQLSPEEKLAGAVEDAFYDGQVEGVEQWWNGPRFEGIKRPYSAADVVSKRGSFFQSPPSSTTARKLFNLLQRRSQEGLPVHTRESDD